jgi:NAD(P)-dependent dehydrogenase (short-subunit alcohol dehydrogenase family)
MADMTNKLVLVTGATNGIGRHVALELAKLGAHVVIVGRNPEKTAGVLEALKAESGSHSIEALIADLSSIAEVRRLAAEVLARWPKVDVLLNNAGAVNMKREVTIDGLELTFATNHLTYQLLATLLLPALERAGGRVINTSSDAHATARMNFDDLQGERLYSAWIQYGRSKLANIYFTREAAGRFAPHGVTVNAYHPGFVASDFLSKGGVWKLLKPMAYLFAVDVPGGARTAVYLASSPDVAGVTGKYFYKCKPKRPRPFAEDDEAAARLWDATERLCAAVP